MTLETLIERLQDYKEKAIPNTPVVINGIDINRIVFWNGKIHLLVEGAKP